jgi:hypothetical protein
VCRVCWCRGCLQEQLHGHNGVNACGSKLRGAALLCARCALTQHEAQQKSA